MKFRTLIILFSIAYLLLGCGQKPFQNNSLSPEQRADDLLHRLTVEEKTALMMNSSPAIPRLDIRKYDWWNEALHGVARNGTATVFPQAIGMAASFNEELLNDVFTAVSDEARVKHRIAREQGEMKKYSGLTFWTPNINIFRDPRWGRGQETYGEDPYLTSIMGVAVIKGLQGEAKDGVDKLHACAKHFAVHSGPEWNRHSFDAENISPRDLWETYLPAFKAAVQKGNVKEVMCAYNRFEGAPCCGSDRLLVQILRDRWGYDGIVLSDCGAINNFYKKGAHMTHPDAEHAVAAAVLSGTDLECGSSYKSISKAVHNGLIDEAQLDVSLKRVLTARFKLGEMDGSSPWDHLPDSLVNSKKHRDLALKMAQESMVLLKNNGILPLSKNSKIALLGPNGNDEKMQWGNYNGIPLHTVTLLEALGNHLDNEIVYDPICGLTSIPESLFDECKVNGKPGLTALFWNNTEMTGKSVDEVQYNHAIKIGKRDSITSKVNLSGIAANITGTFSPTQSGTVNFVFTTGSEVKLKINNQENILRKIPKSIQITSIDVKSGQSYEIEIEWIHKKQGEFRFDIQRNDTPDFEKIDNLVKNIDVVIFAGGISASLEKEEANVFAPGFEGGDRTNIELPGIQRSIIAHLNAIGKKVVLVNFSGSAIGLVPESKKCAAIIQAWYPGEVGGNAIVDILYGHFNPAGRLPVTFYKNVDQLPDFENYDLVGRTYRYMKEEPLYPFGYGLSYTSFNYNDISVKKNQINVGDTLVINVSVTNSGKMDGEEVVQVYLKMNDDADGPNKTLRAFKRVMIPAGKTLGLAFELTSDNLEWWDNNTETMCMHKGEYQLMVGGSSKDKDLKEIDFSVK